MKKHNILLFLIISIFVVNLFAQTPYEVNVRFVDTGLDYIDVSAIQFEVELDPPSGDIQTGPSGLCFVNISDVGAGVPHSFIQFDLDNFANSYTQTSNVRVTIWDGGNIQGAGETIYNKENDLDPASGFMGWAEYYGVGGDPLNVLSDDSIPPVMLSDFSTAVFPNEFIQISWETQSSSNMSLWNLYRQDEGSNYQVVIHTETAVNSTEPHEYIYEDPYVTVGETYFYFLEAVFYDGTATMFGPVSATMTGEEIPELPTETILHGIYPNPFN